MIPLAAITESEEKEMELVQNLLRMSHINPPTKSNDENGLEIK